MAWIDEAVVVAETRGGVIYSGKYIVNKYSYYIEARRVWASRYCRYAGLELGSLFIMLRCAQQWSWQGYRGPVHAGALWSSTARATRSQALFTA